MRRAGLGLAVALFSPTLLIATAPARAGYEWQGSLDSLISAVITQASATIGARNNLPPVSIQWCKGTYYLPAKDTICFNRTFMTQLATKLGDAAVAYVAAHEYAHHLQTNSSKLMRRSKGNILRIELQADCLAGAILGSLKGIRFDAQDIREMLAAAVLLGDQEYDSKNHHGDGENRALALRAGLRFAATGQRDNYYDLFCRIR